MQMVGTRPYGTGVTFCHVVREAERPAGSERRVDATGGGEIEARDKEKAHLGSPPPCDSGPLLACAQRLEARRPPVSSSFPLLATERLQIQGAQLTFIR